MKLSPKNITYFALFISIISTLGSLYFSEFLKLPPCVLCWYQRIFMYPLVVIISIGIWKKDKNLPFFVLPLSVTGLFIAIYHNLLYYGIISEKITPCTTGISCTARQLELFGIITIPILSLIAFLSITVLMLILNKKSINRSDTFFSRELNIPRKNEK